MNTPRIIDRPVLVFFILVLVAGVLAHFHMSEEGNPFFIEYYGFDTSLVYLFNSAAIGFIFFWGATLLLYLCLRQVFQNNKWAFLAVLLFYTSPSIIGAVLGFHLSQFLVTFLLVNIYITKRFIDKPGVIHGILLALVHFVLVVIYPCLIVLPVLTVLFFLLNISTRNLTRKEWVFILPYIGLFAGIFLSVNFIFKIQVLGPLPDFSIFTRKYSWFWYIGLSLNTIPPLYTCYFLFSIVAMNLIYFSNYFQFLKNKWIYTYSFLVPVGMFVAEKFILSGSYGIGYSRLVLTVSMLIIGISGCFEFASWVRKRWGERVYFIFKILFFSLLALQVLICIIAILYLYPNYGMYRNWPLFFMKYKVETPF